MKSSFIQLISLWITYETFDEAGNLLDSSGGRPVEMNPAFTHPRLIAATQGLKAGDETVVRIPADEAFGPVRNDMVISIPLQGRKAAAGEVITLPAGAEGIVVSLSGNEAIVDTNHPFAGKNLTIKLRVIEGGNGNDTGSCCGSAGCC